ncbi:alpha/beta hydrolase [uncultured Aquimarina sp.]|uniref:alpha/beta hydrolase n=1 Tax=uncultured Aquimarina sp. TaxID=575652 RepID=UPI002615B1BE|nr:alpha/beta hydrolase [uncultured Aquimarina sp.]
MKFVILAISFLATFFTNAQVTSDSLAIEEYTYDTEHKLKIYCVRPENYTPKKEYPAIVIFHGGGWSIGEASWGFSNAKHYASKGMVAFSVQYRLQDLENGITPYESVLDAQTAIRWVRKNATKFSIDKNKIASYGWSAGAHLAACAAIFKNLDRPDEKISSAPNLLALKSPALSLLSYSNFQKRLLDKITVAKLSPAEHVSENTPPTIIVMGRTDTVTPLEGSKLYQSNMDKYGNECKLIVYDGVGHLFTPATEPDDGWPNPDKKIRLMAQEEMDQFLEKHGYIN